MSAILLLIAFVIALAAVGCGAIAEERKSRRQEYAPTVVRAIFFAILSVCLAYYAGSL